MAVNVQRSGQGTVRGAARADGATSAPPAERLYAVEPEGVEISSPSPRTVVTCEYRTDLPTDFIIIDYGREWRASCGGAGVSDGANASAHVVVVDNRVQLTHTRILATDHALVECVPCTWRRRWNAAHARRGNVAVWGREWRAKWVVWCARGQGWTGRCAQFASCLGGSFRPFEGGCWI